MRALIACAVALALLACSHDGTGAASPEATQQRVRVGTNPGHAGDGTALQPAKGHQLAAFAAGCFWGVENTFRHVPGVTATAVGYAGGHKPHPTYAQVCTHTTGHAETVLVEFDPQQISYPELLKVFFDSHDPTQRNRQGPDVGDQYRSEIFTFSHEQAVQAGEAKGARATARGKPIATLIEPMPPFWKAEDYHQQYDEKTGKESCPLPRSATDSTAHNEL